MSVKSVVDIADAGAACETSDHRSTIVIITISRSIMIIPSVRGFNWA